MLYEAMKVLFLGYYILKQWMNLFLPLLPLFKEIFLGGSTKAESKNTQNHTADYPFFLKVAGRMGGAGRKEEGLIWNLGQKKGFIFSFKTLNIAHT